MDFSVQAELFMGFSVFIFIVHIIAYILSWIFTVRLCHGSKWCTRKCMISPGYFCYCHKVSQCYVIVKMHNNFSNHCFVNQEHEQKCKIVILKFGILVHIVQHGEAPCINGDTHCTMTLTFFFDISICRPYFFLTCHLFHVNCSPTLPFSLQKQVNEQWMEWLKLWRSEASLSLLIKLSAWHPIGGTKAWNCLTFFLPVHSAISHFLSYISQQGGQREPQKIIFSSNLRICQAMCIMHRDTEVWDIMMRQLYKGTNFWEVCD